MKIAVVLGAMLALASACKKKEAATPATGSGSGSAMAVAAADAAVAPEPPPGPAVLEMEDVDGESNPELLAAFGKQMPSLPAINADGTLLATLDDVSGGPAIPPAMQLTIRKFPSGGKTAELPILTYEEASHAGEYEGENWLTPELAKQLATRGKAIVAKLAGFHSLHAVSFEQPDSSSYEVTPTKIGDLVFAATIRDDTSLTLTLQTAQGKMIHRARVDGYGGHETGDGVDVVCSYDPVMGALWTDPPKPRALYVETRYRFRDDCAEPEPDYLVWSTDPNSTTPEELATDLFDRQLSSLADATADAFALTNDHLMPIGKLSVSAKDHSDLNQSVTMSKDGKSAWGSELSFIDGKTKRISDLLVQTPSGWRIAALAFTDEKDNAEVNRDAKAGKLKAGKLEGEAGDAGLNAAFAKLTTDGATNVDKNLIAFGSGPSERTDGAAAFTKPWNAAWKGKTTVVSSVARLAPSGTTGWVAATVELQKKGYKIPFTVFAVFDKDASGAWTLVHIHFAV